MLMSVIVANDSGGSTSGSIDEATTASSPPPTFAEGKGTAPLSPPPLVSRTPRKVNGAAAVSSAGAAGRSDTLNPSGNVRRNSSKQRRERKPPPSPPKQQQQQSEGKEGEGEVKEWGEGAGGGTNMTSPSASEQPQQNDEQDMRQLGKRGMWREALEVLGRVPEPSQREYVAAIAACDFAGEPRQALRVHALMVEQGLKPTPVRESSSSVTGGSAGGGLMLLAYILSTASDTVMTSHR